ncbi:MAG TPA: glycosyltransferase [Flavisolibacter sp.]|jgi:sterol 3beta-glucosyltransferase|nr:glycosyltransferase [Flavisolibacter sp.]
MNIAILTLGTRGDVQPYAVLGKALLQRGHHVVFSTAGNFENLVRSYGLDFVPVKADFQALLLSEEGKKIRKNPFLARKQLAGFVYPMLEDALQTFYALAQQSDKVLFHIKTMADNFADQFPHKMIKADVVPASQPTRAFPNPVFSALALPSFLNKFTYQVTEWGLKMWKKPVRDFRDKAGLPKNFRKPHLPTLYGISEHFLPKPSDYPDNSFFTGFWTERSASELDESVLDFVKAGEPPLLITFGSMPFESKVKIKDLVTAVAEQLRTRIILVRGWGLSRTEDLERNPAIKVIDAAPYDKLFPLVKAVVHHGGIGTIAACLQAGKPFLTCPVLYPMGDQYFWGKIAEQKGVGLHPLPLKKLTIATFLSSVNRLLRDERLHQNAEKFARIFAYEEGISNAIALIEQGES